MRLCKRITELCNVRRECRDVAGYEMTTVSVHGMQGHAGHLACFQGLAREPNLFLGSADGLRIRPCVRQVGLPEADAVMWQG